MKKKIILGIVLLSFLSPHCNAKAQDKQKDITAVEHEISALQSKQKVLESEVIDLVKKNKTVSSQMADLKVSNEKLQAQLDSVGHECDRLSSVQKADKDTLSAQIEQTDKSVRMNEQTLSARTIWGIVILAVILCTIGGVVLAFRRKLKNGSTTIDEVRKAQELLEKAQTKMQEESVKLDNKLLEIAEKQINEQKSAPASTGTRQEIDHSLALKVADEIVRIEMNLSRMDASIKGYKQLSKAVQRIKDNFSANNYEIVDMLGKPYKQGIKAAVTFVTDESLEVGKQIITRIIKPQVNYNGQMIQAAQIEVSQSE